MSTITDVLTDEQQAALESAGLRKDGTLDLSSIAKGRGAQILGAHLMEKELVREVRAKPGMPVWRQDDADRRFAPSLDPLRGAAGSTIPRSAACLFEGVALAVLELQVPCPAGASLGTSAPVAIAR